MALLFANDNKTDWGWSPLCYYFYVFFTFFTFFFQNPKSRDFYVFAVFRTFSRTMENGDFDPCRLFSVSQENPPPWEDLTFFHFFHKLFRILNRFLTHLLYVPVYARLHIFIQLSPILTQLCHIKRDYPVRIICSKCPQSAKTHAFRRVRKSLIALLIVVCGKSL